MISTLLTYSIFLLLAYFLWIKVFKIYYRYYYYLKQGVASPAIPVPFLGDLLTLKAALERPEVAKWSYVEDAWCARWGKN